MKEERPRKAHSGVRGQGTGRAVHGQNAGHGSHPRRPYNNLPPPPALQQHMQFWPPPKHLQFGQAQMLGANYPRGMPTPRGFPLRPPPVGNHAPLRGPPGAQHQGHRPPFQFPPAQPFPGVPVGPHPGLPGGAAHPHGLPFGVQPRPGPTPPNQLGGPRPNPSVQQPLPGPPQNPGLLGAPPSTAAATIAAPARILRPPAEQLPPVSPSSKKGEEKNAGAEEKPAAEEDNPKLPEDEEEDAVTLAWTAHKSDEGQVYYFNTKTNESSWTKPEGFRGDVKDTKPTSQLRVPGTQWYEIHCEDGSKYYFNNVSEETSWTIPEEVASLKQQVKEAKAYAPLSAVKAVNQARANMVPYNPPKELEDVTFTDEDVKREPLRMAPLIQAATGLPPLPREIPPPQPPPEHLRKKSHAELLSEFYDLLSEKGVNSFSRWEKELPKLISDERYKAIPSMKDRKAGFEEFCKSTAEQRRASKLGASGQAELDSDAAKTGFRSLMHEAATTSSQAGEGEQSATEPVLHSETMYRELESSYKSDSRWLACSEKLREELFDERIEELKIEKQKADEKSREASIAAYSVQLKARADEESVSRSLLSSSGITGSSRWSKSKDSLAQDPRYKAAPRELRERLFRDFIVQQKTDEDAKAKERLERERKEHTLKQQLQKKVEEADKRQKKAAHADALANYLTLLNEAVKDPEARWSEWRSKLQRDPQKRANNPALDSKEAESVFKQHINDLHKKAFTAFSELMDVILRPLLPKSKEEEMPGPLKSFTKAEKLWQDDLQTSRLTSRERERVWKRYVEELLLERDDPGKLAGRVRLANNRKAAEKDRNMLRDGNQERDQAYEREYLAPDRKRLKRD